MIKDVSPHKKLQTSVKISTKNVSSFALDMWRNFCFGVGHVVNDVLVSLWDIYLIIFFTQVKALAPWQVGIISLVGNTSDAVLVLLTGLVMDKPVSGCCNRYGRRKLWHLIGSVLCIAGCFLFFSPMPGEETSSSAGRTAYYSSLTILFSLGYSSVQLSYLALIPVFAKGKTALSQANSVWNAFSIVSYLLACFIAIKVISQKSLDIYPSDNGTNSTIDQKEISKNFTSDGYFAFESFSKVGPEDGRKFQILALACAAIGVMTTAIFQIGFSETACQEQRLNKMNEDTGVSVIEVPTDKSNENERKTQLTQNIDFAIKNSILPSIHKLDEEKSFSISKDQKMFSELKGQKDAMSVLDWLREPHLYPIAMLYITVLFFQAIHLGYQPLYVESSLQMGEMAIATVPLVGLVGGLLATCITSPMHKLFGYKKSNILCYTIGLAASIWIFYGSREMQASWGAYCTAFIFGFSSYALQVTVLCMANQFIGDHSESGAFVMAAISFAEKFFTGIGVMSLQLTLPTDEEPTWQYKWILSLACGGACIAGLIGHVPLAKVKLEKLRKDKSIDS